MEDTRVQKAEDFYLDLQLTEEEKAEIKNIFAKYKESIMLKEPAALREEILADTTISQGYKDLINQFLTKRENTSEENKNKEKELRAQFEAAKNAGFTLDQIIGAVVKAAEESSVKDKEIVKFFIGLTK